MNRSAAQMLDAWFAQKRAPRLTRRSPQRLLTVAAHDASADVAARRTQLTNDADGAPPWMLSGDAQDQPLPLGGNVGTPRFRDDSSSASRRAKQNDATAQPCPARPSRACLASRTNRVPAVTRIGGRGDGAAVDDGPGCRRRADAAALSSRGRDLGGRGRKRRVLRQTDGGRAQTSLSWLADTLLSQDRAAPIRFCRPTPAERRAFFVGGFVDHLLSGQRLDHPAAQGPATAVLYAVPTAHGGDACCEDCSIWSKG